LEPTTNNANHVEAKTKLGHYRRSPSFDEPRATLIALTVAERFGGRVRLRG
jgi:hypothetical protein